jgi:hypothetical protein
MAIATNGSDEMLARLRHIFIFESRITVPPMLLANSPGFKVSTDNKRYTDWRGCYAHPRTLTREDFPRLLSSTHHFARKFAFDVETLRDLDKAVEHKTHEKSSRKIAI